MITKNKRIPLNFPNLPLYQIGDQIIAKDGTMVIFEIADYYKGFFQRQYSYKIVYIPKKVTVEVLEKPFSEWDESDHFIQEGEIYYGLKQGHFEIKRYSKEVFEEEVCKEA